MDFRDISVESILDDVITLEPNKAIITGHKILLDKDKGVNLNVHFSASNGFFYQTINMRFLNGRWVSKTQVERDGEIIFEKIDQNYPN